MPEHVKFEECSEEVGNALGPDVMKSVKHLIPDILASLPLLLYQGAHQVPILRTALWSAQEVPDLPLPGLHVRAGTEDAQDGPASNEPWMHDLPWHGRTQFNAAKRELWRLQLPGQEGEAAGSRAAETQVRRCFRPFLCTVLCLHVTVLHHVRIVGLAGGCSSRGRSERRQEAARAGGRLLA